MSEQQAPLTYEGILELFRQTDLKWQEMREEFQESDRRFQEKMDRMSQETNRKIQETGRADTGNR